MTDHVLKRRADPASRPAILIAKDLVAGEEDEHNTDIRTNFQQKQLQSKHYHVNAARNYISYKSKQ